MKGDGCQGTRAQRDGRGTGTGLKDRVPIERAPRRPQARGQALGVMSRELEDSLFSFFHILFSGSAPPLCSFLATLCALPMVAEAAPISCTGRVAVSHVLKDAVAPRDGESLCTASHSSRGGGSSSALSQWPLTKPYSYQTGTSSMEAVRPAFRFQWRLLPRVGPHQLSAPPYPLTSDVRGWSLRT